MATPADFERAVDLFVELMPQASVRARAFILARTPGDLQTIMQRLVTVGVGPTLHSFDTMAAEPVTSDVEVLEGR